MAKDVINSASLVPISEMLSQLASSIFGTVHAVKEVLIQKENFKKFSTYLEKTACLLKELSELNLDYSESLKTAIEILNRETKIAKQLVLECKNKNKVYLLLNCHRIVKRLDNITKEISHALSLIPLASLGISMGISDEISKLCKNMLGAEYRTAVAEQKILEKIASATQECNVNRSHANDLLFHIAEAVGFSTEHSSFKKEFKEFKNEIEDAKRRKDMPEDTQMEQIIALLENADATKSHEEREEYFNKRNSLGRQPLQPLQAFYCPITQDVMVDPVETSSGKTFERAAIEKWFAEGHNSCPLTQISLDTSFLRPNKPLQKLIEEWRDRNNLITIVSLKPKLQSTEEHEVLQSLEKLQGLLVERELHRQWVIMEDYIPVLIGLLSAKNRDIRTSTLAILCILAKDSEDNKEAIAKVDRALELIIHSLARQIGESKLALQLLLDLSRNHLVKHSVGNIQGCIFLLATASNSNDNQAAKNAEELLNHLSFCNQNVIEMAKANFFKPLLQLLSSGEEDIRIIMAETLSQIELTDNNKVSLFEEGALEPLLQLLTHDDLEVKKVAIEALHNLSDVPQNGLKLIREGAIGPLLELLYRHSLLSPRLREQVAATIMHLAISTTTQVADIMQVLLLESEDIFRLFSLISFTGPNIQKSILRTFLAVCHSPLGVEIREKLRQFSALQVLVQLCDQDNQIVRGNAVKLFCCLTQDGNGDTLLEHVGQRCIERLLTIITTSNDMEEIAAAMGIISNLPKDPQITLWLLDAGALNIISTCLTHESRNASYRMQIIENAAAALCRFIAPSNLEWQKRVAEIGIIPVLVQLLVCGTTLTQQNAAISLKHFSENSTSLSNRVKQQWLSWCCLKAPVKYCPVHLGICTVESSFCILEANALEPLVRMLGETDPGVCEASLDALLTLIDGERLQRGSKVLAEANAIAPIIKLLSLPSASLQEKTLKALERIFRLVEFKQQYGTSAQMPLVEITQRGSGSMKSLAAKVLAQLNLLTEQSSYF